MTKTKKEATKNGLAGWARIIRNQGKWSRNQEQKRKKAAALLIKETESLSLNDQLKVLVTAHDTGRITSQELLQTLRNITGLPEPE